MIRFWLRACRRMGACTLALIASAGAGLAQEYCVVCSEPAATYRCQVENIGPAISQPVKLSCISALARDGRHASCSVRGGTVLDCVGPIKRVDVLGKPTATAQPPGTASLKPAPSEPYVLPEPQKPPPDPNLPPSTVAEAVQRATKSAGDGASKTGQAINDSARKTWNCLTSFFKSC